MGNPGFDRVNRAWERFFATGEVDERDIPDTVARSWRRCRDAGLDPRAPKVPVRQDREELAQTIRRNGPFIEAALPFMRFLESAVRSTGYVLVLTDDSGIVVEAFGDDEVLAVRRFEPTAENHQALLRFVLRVIDTKGFVDDADLAAVRRAGYSDGQIAETIAFIGLATYSNLFNHVFGTPLDLPAAPEI